MTFAPSCCFKRVPCNLPVPVLSYTRQRSVLQQGAVKLPDEGRCWRAVSDGLQISCNVVRLL